MGVFLPVPDRNQHRRATIRRSRSRSQVVVARRRGHYVSLTSGFRCVVFRKWSQPRDQKDPKPTRKGIALNLDQWVQMRKLVVVINNDHPVLATALPCYMQDGHLATFQCRECYPFLKLALSLPTHSFWNPIERDSNVVPDACRSFYTTLPHS